MSDAYTERLNLLPEDLRSRIDWGLYGGTEQFFIVGVDGTLARLGNSLPDDEALRNWVATADVENARLRKRMNAIGHAPEEKGSANE